MIGLPTEIARGFHGRNVIGYHFTVAAKSTGRQHQRLAANILDAPVRTAHPNARNSPVFGGKEVGNVSVRQYVDAPALTAIDQPCHHISPSAFLDRMEPLTAVTKGGAPAKVQFEHNPMLSRQPVQRNARLFRNRSCDQGIGLSTRLGHDIGQKYCGRILDPMGILLSGSGRTKRTERHCAATHARRPALQDQRAGSRIKGGQGRCKSAGAAADNEHVNLDIKWPSGCDKNRHGSDPSSRTSPTDSLNKIKINTNSAQGLRN